MSIILDPEHVVRLIIKSVKRFLTKTVHGKRLAFTFGAHYGDQGSDICNNLRNQMKLDWIFFLKSFTEKTIITRS